MDITFYAWPVRMSKNAVTTTGVQFKLRKIRHVELKHFYLC